MYLVGTNAGSPVPDIWQIGTDQGLLDKPVNISSFIPFSWSGGETPWIPPYGYQTINDPRVLMAPAERMDVIIDFAGYEGQTITLRNDAPGPYPDGGTDFNPDLEGKILQFRVGRKLCSKDKSFDPAAPHARLRKGRNKIVRLADGDGNLAPGVTPQIIRSFIFLEQEGPGGPIQVLLNNTHWNGRNQETLEPIEQYARYEKGNLYVSELPQVGSTEIWEFINLTGDAHPIHTHLVQFRILNRQIFNVGDSDEPHPPEYVGYSNIYEEAWGPDGTQYGAGSPYLYLSTPTLGGNPNVDPFLYNNPIPPDPNEFGWKDTVKTFPSTVTRIVVRWAPQDVGIEDVAPGQNLYVFDPTATMDVKDDCFGYPGGPGYEWHCHILDHEDNEMMRPYNVINDSQ